MKSLLKRILVLVIAISCVLGTFVGCGGDEGEEIDPNRTQIYITMFNGGYGTEWLKELDNEFEKLYPEYQVIVTGDYADSMFANMSGSHLDIYINERALYNDYAKSGKLADITDWLTETVYDENYNFVGAEEGSVSIYDRMPEIYQEVYNVNDKYYATPFYEGTWGIYYDADMFTANGWIGHDNFTGLDGVDNTEDDTWGPDGTNGTPDDGLPATWVDFKTLLTLIKGKGYTPFTFSSMSYIQKGVFGAAWAAYEGKEDFDLNFSFKGYENDLGIEIDPNDAESIAMLQKQEGKKAALTFFNEIMHNQNATDNARAGLKHTAAQAEFVQSVQKHGTQGNKRIAMFLEGNYWQNEARGTFNAMAKRNSNWSYTKRNFKFMPFPRFVGEELDGVAEQTNTKTTLFSTGSDAFLFVNKKSQNEPGVKLFYQFINSNQGCIAFAKHSGCFRTLDFKMSEEDLAKCTVLTQDMYKYRYGTDEYGESYTEMCYELASCKTRMMDYEGFQGFDLTTQLSQPVNSWHTYFHDSTDVNAYFNGMYTYWNANNRFTTYPND